VQALIEITKKRDIIQEIALIKKNKAENNTSMPKNQCGSLVFLGLLKENKFQLTLQTILQALSQ
jgi:hypothetical protein